MNKKVNIEKEPRLHLLEKTYSEAYQDIFVLQCFNGMKNGTYLEIGAGHPMSGNNTYILEKGYEWIGLSIDYGWDDWNDDCIITTFDGVDWPRDEYRKNLIKNWNKARTNPVLLTNAITCDWEKIIDENYNTNIIDYLQVDIDPPGGTYQCLERLPFDKIDFRVITYEHDAYVVGDEWRSKSRKFLESKGFILVAGNISVPKLSLKFSSNCYHLPNNPFEDWWVNKKYMSEVGPYININSLENDLSPKKYLSNKYF